jgi:tetratricopeptide (TPR) repeat protein
LDISFNLQLKINGKLISLSSQKYEDLSQEADKIKSEKPDDAKVLFNKALELAEKEGQKAFFEFFKGKIDEIEGNYYLAIGHFENSVNLEPKNFFLIKQFGIICRKINDSDYKIKAIELFNNAISDYTENEDYVFFQIKGLIENELELYNDALTSFERALYLEKEDIVSLKGKGISLYKLGEYERSLEEYKGVLKNSSEDFDSLKFTGIILNKFGNYLRLSKPEESVKKYKAAIKYFDKALKIKEDKYTLEYKGICIYKIGQLEGKLDELLKEAITYMEGFSNLSNEISNEKSYFKEKAHTLFNECVNFDEDSDEKVLGYLDRALQIDPNYYGALYEKSDILATRGRDIESKECLSKAHSIKMLIKVIGEFKREKEDILKDIKANDKKFAKFVGNKRSVPKNFHSFLAVLRKWNSYTPILPSEKDDNKGGGYFLFHKGKGIVIDPGFNFIENFYREGFQIADIDAILVSHAHNDHTADIESILTLIHKHNEKKGNEYKTIDLFLNLGTFKKYSGLLNLRDDRKIGTVTILMPDIEYNFSNYGITIFTIKAKHDEIIDDKYALSFLIYVKDVEEGKCAKIGFTCDTGWNFEDESYFTKSFIDHEPKLLIAHLGSIKSEEFKYLEATTEDKRNNCFYPNHLGLLGMAKLLEKIQYEKPLIIFSEFGEELKKYRIAIAEKFAEIFDIHCLAGDVGLYVRLKDLFVFCCVEEKFIDCRKINTTPICDDSILLFHNDDPDLGTLFKVKERFDNKRILLPPLACRIKPD